MSARARRNGRFISLNPPGVHNYASYIAGCRCTICRAAKAEYARNYRAAAAARRREAAEAGGVHVAPGISHGISGYRDSSCRCDVCFRAAKASRMRRDRRLAAVAS